MGTRPRSGVLSSIRAWQPAAVLLDVEGRLISARFSGFRNPRRRETVAVPLFDGQPGAEAGGIASDVDVERGRPPSPRRSGRNAPLWPPRPCVISPSPVHDLGVSPWKQGAEGRRHPRRGYASREGLRGPAADSARSFVVVLGVFGLRMRSARPSGPWAMTRTPGRGPRFRLHKTRGPWRFFIFRAPSLGGLSGRITRPKSWTGRAFGPGAPAVLGSLRDTSGPATGSRSVTTSATTARVDPTWSRRGNHIPRAAPLGAGRRQTVPSMPRL